MGNLTGARLFVVLYISLSPVLLILPQYERPKRYARWTSG
jgi:hypothetical protein